MWFGKLPIEQCAGCVLAHSVGTGKQRITKGTLLDDDLIRQLIDNDVSHLVVARCDDNDVTENDAASQIAVAAIQGAVGVRADKAHTGRMNIYASCDGLLSYRSESVVAANSVSEDITLSVLAPNQWVLTGRMIASAKIIPFFDALLQNEGDIGARHLIQQYPEKVTEVQIGSESVLKDYDTAEALQKLQS